MRTARQRLPLGSVPLRAARRIGVAKSARPPMMQSVLCGFSLLRCFSPRGATRRRHPARRLALVPRLVARRRFGGEGQAAEARARARVGASRVSGVTGCGSSAAARVTRSMPRSHSRAACHAIRHASSIIHPGAVASDSVALCCNHHPFTARHPVAIVIVGAR